MPDAGHDEPQLTPGRETVEAEVEADVEADVPRKLKTLTGQDERNASSEVNRILIGFFSSPP